MRRFVRFALYALLCLLVFALQSVLAPLSLPLGAAPELTPVLIACIAAFESPCPAALIGLWTGLLRGTLSPAPQLYALSGFFSAAAASILMRTRLRPCAGAALPVCLVLTAVPFLFYALPFFGASPARTLQALALQEGFALASFFPIWAVCRCIGRLGSGERYIAQTEPMRALPAQSRRKGGADA